MYKISSLSELNDLLLDSPMLLVYFSGKNCGVCQAVKPKIKDLIKKYPKVKIVEVATEEAISVSVHFSVFSVPTVMLFVYGKESFKLIRYFSIDEVEAPVRKYYEQIFKHQNDLKI